MYREVTLTHIHKYTKESMTFCYPRMPGSLVDGLGRIRIVWICLRIFLSYERVSRELVAHYMGASDGSSDPVKGERLKEVDSRYADVMFTRLLELGPQRHTWRKSIESLASLNLIVPDPQWKSCESKLLCSGRLIRLSMKSSAVHSETV